VLKVPLNPSQSITQSVNQSIMFNDRINLFVSRTPTPKCFWDATARWVKAETTLKGDAFQVVIMILLLHERLNQAAHFFRNTHRLIIEVWKIRKSGRRSIFWSEKALLAEREIEYWLELLNWL